MNKLDLKNTGGFPFDADVLAFMQDSYNIFNQLGWLAGNFSILHGCEIVGRTLRDGVVFMNGEVLPFKGGNLDSKVIIKQIEKKLVFEDGVNKKVEITRYATFGRGTSSINWSAFKRPDNHFELMSKLTNLTTSLTNLTKKFNNHKHSWAQIRSKPTKFPPASHRHKWREIDDKPTKFPPTSHKHKWREIDDKPNLLEVLHKGSFKIGDVYDDAKVKIDFGKSIGISNYIVIGHLRSSRSDYDMDNDVITTIGARSTSYFYLLLSEIASHTQTSLYFDYIIIKR